MSNELDTARNALTLAALCGSSVPALQYVAKELAFGRLLNVTGLGALMAALAISIIAAFVASFSYEAGRIIFFLASVLYMLEVVLLGLLMLIIEVTVRAGTSWKPLQVAIGNQLSSGPVVSGGGGTQGVANCAMDGHTAVDPTATSRAATNQGMGAQATSGQPIGAIQGGRTMPDHSTNNHMVTDKKLDEDHPTSAC
jgi:hypothetical protein